MLCTFLAILSMLSHTCVPWFLKLMMKLSFEVYWLLSNVYVKFFFAWSCWICHGLNMWHIHIAFNVLTSLSFAQTNELYQLASVAFCLLVAWVCIWSLPLWLLVCLLLVPWLILSCICFTLHLQQCYIKLPCTWSSDVLFNKIMFFL